MTDLTPGIIMIIAAFGVPYLPHHLRQIYMLIAIGLSSLSLTAGEGIHWMVPLMGQELILHHADHLTLPFGLVFHLAAVLNVIYGWHEKKVMEHTAGLAYAGAAIAALHAGDLITLFIWWEATAITSVFLILASRSVKANHAAMRYLLVQVSSGVILLAGAAFYWRETGSWAFTAMTLDSMSTWLIFIAFGIKAAFPLLNGWLQDAYPEATVIGTVMLSAFTTKLAIYALARGFAGTEMLIWIGIAMALLPALYAVLENDLRRMLAYSLNNQLGFMVIAIGIGTELAINGAVAHAFIHILYKALLFMSIGAVLFRTGTAKASDLGGLYRLMPMTMVFCVVGAMTISAVPFFGSFISKSLMMSSIGKEGLVLIYLGLMATSAGVFGIRVPYFAFFNRDAGYTEKQVSDAPLNMKVAMGIAAVLCVVIGIMPQHFFMLLPYPIDYQPYYASSIIGQLELLVFAALGFVVMLKFGLYPKDKPSVILNSDWFYRRLAPSLIAPFIKVGFLMAASKEKQLIAFGTKLFGLTRKLSEHPLSGPVIPGPAAIVQGVLLLMILAVVYAALA